MVRDSTIQKLTEALRDIGEASVAELAVIVSVSSETARKAMIELEESDSHIKSEMRSGCKYYRWTDNIPSGTKNASGATDMTPYIAMVNTVSESKLVEGAVYATDTFNGVVGEPGFVLVLSAHRDFAETLTVYETSFKYFDQTTAHRIKGGGREYYVDPCRVQTLSEKRFGECQFFLDMEEFMYIRQMVGLNLRITDMCEANCIATLRGSGWMKIHDDAVFAQAKKQLESWQLEQPQVIQPDTQPDAEWWKREASIWKEAFMAVCQR